MPQVCQALPVLLVRLLVLAVLAVVLGLGWLVTGAAALSTLDDVCLTSAPSAANGIRQEVDWWPPRLTCVYGTPAGEVRQRRDSEVRLHVAGVGVTGLVAFAAWTAAAVYVFRRR
jgi:hypothetical protein